MMASEGGLSPAGQRRRSKSEGTGVSSFSSRMKCEVCSEQYRWLKYLPYFPSFYESCLQDAAGDPTSFPCPNCRAPVPLSPEESTDKDKDAADPFLAPRRALCDVCSEDREATHACLDCRQLYCLPCRTTHDGITVSRGHSVASLAPGGSIHRGARRLVDEWCGQHGSHRLLFHCSQCLANICIQCKLTLHLDHPTCDIADEGLRIRSKLEERLRDADNQIVRLGSLLTEAEGRRFAIESWRRMVEQDIRNRAQILVTWAYQSRDTAVRSAQETMAEIMSPLLSNSRYLREKHAELKARQDLLQRVLWSANDAELLSLEPQLHVSSLDETILVRIETELKKAEEPNVRVRHERASINELQVESFVGGVKLKKETEDPTPGGDEDDTSSDGSGWKPPREFTYSQESNLDLSCLCPTGNSGLWVKYSSDGRPVMKLFDKNGKVVRVVDNAVEGDSLATVLGDMLIAASPDSDYVEGIEPNGEKFFLALGVKHAYLVQGAACGYPFVCQKVKKQAVSRLTFISKDPFQYTKGVLLESNMLGKLMDVSAEERSLVFRIPTDLCDTIRIFTNRGPRKGLLFDGYYRLKGFRIADCRFCRINNREMLLVVFEGDDRVHVLDHAMNGRFVRYLDTGSCSLRGPRRLATDYDKHVWIGCQDGKVVVVDLQTGDDADLEKLYRGYCTVCGSTSNVTV